MSDSSRLIAALAGRYRIERELARAVWRRSTSPRISGITGVAELEKR